MIPLRDTLRSKTIPFVNYSLILLCGFMFLYELSAGEHVGKMINRFGVIPAAVTTTVASRSFDVRSILPLLTSMFLHGGWLHLIGNMLFLYVFGDNVEDRLGHFRYLFFYILTGISASLVEVFFRPGSAIPLIGASGAIAGVMGAYFLLFPRARIMTMIPLLIFFPVVDVPAFLFLGVWLLFQFVQGLGGQSGNVEDGIAWWAHAGGFVAGALLLPLFLLLRRLQRA